MDMDLLMFWYRLFGVLWFSQKFTFIGNNNNNKQRQLRGARIFEARINGIGAAVEVPLIT